MRDLRAWAREGRLLAVLVRGTRSDGLSDLDGLCAVDFLLQHPSMLRRFARLSRTAWSPSLLPSLQEARSTEETFLAWKRSLARQVIVPMLRRLVARGLIERDSLYLRPTAPGHAAAQRLQDELAPERHERIERVIAEFRVDPEQANTRLRRVLVEGRA
jgi:DNA-binding MarR family transcriptional regulator